MVIYLKSTIPRNILLYEWMFPCSTSEVRSLLSGFLYNPVVETPSYPNSKVMISVFQADIGYDLSDPGTMYFR